MWAHSGTSAATAGRDNGKAAGTSRLKLLMMMMMMSCSYYYHCYYYYPFFFFYQQSVTRIKQVCCFVDVDTNVGVGVRTILAGLMVKLTLLKILVLTTN